MKKITIEIFLVGVFLSFLLVTQSFANTVTPLNPVEKEGLLYMLDEERMAMEVYSSYAEQWDMQIFSNLKGAEKRHFDLLSRLAAKFNIDVPALQEGIFTHPDVQELYNEFVSYGSVSLEAALISGAKIEETDIVDLEYYLSKTKNRDLILAYETLLKSSENHLRGFNRILSRQGINYEPDYLNEERFDAIINLGVQCRSGEQPKDYFRRSGSRC